MELGFAFLKAPVKNLKYELKELPLTQFLKTMKQLLKRLEHARLI